MNYLVSGNATLLSGATLTSFDTNEVVNENPYLEFDTSIDVWRTTATTPLYENTLNVDSIDEDIDGQDRPLLSNPGADNYSLESIRYRPLTPEDVGPNTNGGSTTSISPDSQSSAPLIYPLPTDNLLHLKNINPQVRELELRDSEGKIILTRKIEKAINETTVNASELDSGLYFLKLSSNYSAEIFKILIQH